MLQVWRLQQVAAILTLALLSVNLALQIYNFMNWREGLFASPYSAVPILLLIIVAVIWGIAIVWDLRMKMWREQMAVAMERNPYSKEKMYAKEISGYALFWLPVLDNLGKTDPEARASADALRSWIKKALKDDPAAQGEWSDLLKYIGKYPASLEEFEKKG